MNQAQRDILNRLTLSYEQASILMEYLDAFPRKWHDGLIEITCMYGGIWFVAFDDYDGPEDPRTGSGNTPQEAYDDFIEHLDMVMARRKKG